MEYESITQLVLSLILESLLRIAKQLQHACLS
jgi:hypothetical protein